MNTFDKMREEFFINWVTVIIGWNNYFHQPPLISFDEIKEFAFKRLESLDCSPFEEETIIKLLSLNETDRETISVLLNSLIPQSNATTSIEERKWRVIRLDEMLNSIPVNPIDGLIALTDFWASYDYPSDSPHIVQGKDNEISPVDYYKESFFQKMLLAHRKWICKEKQEIHNINCCTLCPCPESLPGAKTTELKPENGRL